VTGGNEKDSTNPALEPFNEPRIIPLLAGPILEGFSSVILVLKPDVTASQMEEIQRRVEELGFTAHLSRGTERTILGIIGDEEKLQSTPLAAISGVEQVIPVLKPYKLASREKHREETIVDVKGVKIGGGNLLLIAGPCAIEGEEILLEIAKAVKTAGANMLRGGAFKPRTSPYAFQGLGEPGLKILRDVGDEVGLPVVTEVMDTRHVELIERYTDMFQIGARNMQNFNLLSEVGQTKKPVLLKRGMSASVKDLLMSAEYILASGNQQVVLCERGVRSFDDSTRNMMDLAAIPNVKRQCHLPIIVDPSHGTGKPELIPAMAMAGLAAGADGVHIEVHSRPEEALSDGAQALRPPEFAAVVSDLRRMAKMMGKTF
jgi:3-deoxy-7-phosphoheptulonate synthase